MTMDLLKISEDEACLSLINMTISVTLHVKYRLTPMDLATQWH
jgi:hypothetical protein